MIKNIGNIYNINAMNQKTQNQKPKSSFLFLLPVLLFSIAFSIKGHAKTKEGDLASIALVEWDTEESSKRFSRSSI